MTELAKHFQIDFNAAAPKKAVVLCDKLRITVLTAGLLRLEFDPEQQFDDRPTQLLWKKQMGLLN
jgi:hypothetical protein